MLKDGTPVPYPFFPRQNMSGSYLLSPADDPPSKEAGKQAFPKADTHVHRMRLSVRQSNRSSITVYS